MVINKYAPILAKIAHDGFPCSDHFSMFSVENLTNGLMGAQYLCNRKDVRVTYGMSSIPRTVKEVTDKGRAMLAEVDLVASLIGFTPHGDEKAKAALWVWLLVHGFTPGQWNINNAYGSRGEIAHILHCGLNLAKSTNVRDDVWSIWGGTFHEDSTAVGVTGQATCRCAKVKDFTVYATADSITSLLGQVILN